MKINTTDRVIAICINFLRAACIFLVAFTLGIFFQLLDVAEHITTIFLFAVFLISLSTEGYFYGILSSICGMLAINYVFTYPYFRFDFNIHVNLISALIMMTVSILTGMLTTQIKQYETEKTEIEKERLRANLLRAVSHDLRTPLTAIYSAGSTLRNKKNLLTEEQQDTMLKNIEDNSIWLVRMVENLLSVTQISNDQVEITKTPVILDELVDSVMTKFMNRYPDQSVTLDIPDTVIVVSLDTLLIEQVLMNLLENAVFHAKDRTYISFRIFTAGKKVVFEISDDGCGIREDILRHIFSGTYDVPEATADAKKRNFGIGLSLCATIIKAHKGEITAENRKGGGSVFRFTLDREDMTDDKQ